jgi:hypothetical protein
MHDPEQKNPLFGGYNALPACPSDWSSVKMMTIEHWWNDSDRRKLSVEHW